MDVSITVDRNGNLISGEESLVDVSMTEPPPVAAPETQTPPIPPVSSRDTKKQQKAKTLAQPAPRIEKSDEKDGLADDDAGVLELNDLLDELQPESEPVKENGNSSDDEDMDLETLFFKDKADDDDFDTLADEGTAFWEDKK